MKAIFCILIFTLSTIISPYQCYLIQIPVVSTVFIWVCVACELLLLVGNGYPITMKAIFSSLLLVLSSLSILVVIQVPVKSVVSNWVCIVCRRVFLEPKAGCSTCQKLTEFLLNGILWVLVFVLSTVTYISGISFIYQWYQYFYGSVHCGLWRCFLESMLNCTNFQKCNSYESYCFALSCFIH